MKKTYPTYTANRKKPVTEKVFNSLSNKNQTAILKFLEICSVKSKSQKREFGRKTALIKFLDFLEKDYDKITYEDYIKISKAISESNLGVYAKNGDKDTIKRFLKENYSDWRERFKELKLLSYETQSEDKKLTANDLITEKEFEKLIKATSNMTYKTLISVLYETASRPEEVLKIRWSDVDLKKDIIYFYSSKTKKKRAVPVQNCIPHLRRLQEELEAKEEDYVFKSREGKFTNSGLNYILKNLSKKAKIKKYISGYTFRHTRLSYLITKLSPKVYEEIAGHSLQMGMKTYAHLSQDKIIQEMNEKIFEIKELTEEDKEEIKILKQNVEELKQSSITNLQAILFAIKNNDFEPLNLISEKLKERIKN
jgi:integrase